MSRDEPPVLLWFRRDLRLEDNPSLVAAIETGRPVIPVFILEEAGPARPPGRASLWWLDKSLSALAGDLVAMGSRLILRRGDPGEQLLRLAAETGASRLVWSKSFEPDVQGRDRKLASRLQDNSVQPESFNASLLFEPGQIRTGAGGLYSVFTPFWRAARPEIGPLHVAPRPKSLKAPKAWPASDDRRAWGLHPRAPDWSTGFDIWRPGEAGAKARLQTMIDTAIGDYPTARDVPGVEGTSRLSPHLVWGEIGPRQVYAAVEQACAQNPSMARGGDKYLAELGWREFNYNILALHPKIAGANLKPAFDAFPWRHDLEQATLWQRGETGYPIVDAGMRQLWRTGWMHNRVRMIVASFLVKHLLIDWRVGEAWFWDTLIDADPASNPGGWQWTAGSGADAAPFFRIFNPVSQAERFDPDGAYVRAWVPELSNLPNSSIHAPWTAQPLELVAGGVRLGSTYPYPMVDHVFARQRALAAFESLKSLGAAG